MYRIFFEKTNLNVSHFWPTLLVKVEIKKNCCLHLTKCHRQQIKLHPTNWQYPLINYPGSAAGIETRSGVTTTTGVPGLPPGGTGGPPPQKGGPHLKDTTPDSGVVPDNNNSNSNSNQSTASSNQKQAKLDSSQNSLLSR